MNQQEIKAWVGKPVFLVSWPWAGPVNTAEGKQYFGGKRAERRKQWQLIKLTKGGMAMITDGENTISVPPYYVERMVTIVEGE